MLREKLVYELKISKDEVEGLCFEKINDFIELVEEKGVPELYNSLVIVYSGFDEVEEEVYEIPSIRKYNLRLFRECPEIFFHLSFELEALQLYLATISDFDRLTEKNGRIMVALSVEKDDFLTIAYNLFVYGEKNNALEKARERLKVIEEIVSF